MSDTGTYKAAHKNAKPPLRTHIPTTYMQHDHDSRLLRWKHKFNYFLYTKFRVRTKLPIARTGESEHGRRYVTPTQTVPYVTFFEYILYSDGTVIQYLDRPDSVLEPVKCYCIQDCPKRIYTRLLAQVGLCAPDEEDQQYDTR